MGGCEATARWLQHFGGIAAAPKTYVYVDGFNLFYGALRRAPYRWLDLAKLCQLYLPNDDVRKIKYFTAIVSARLVSRRREFRKTVTTPFAGGLVTASQRLLARASLLLPAVAPQLLDR